MAHLIVEIGPGRAVVITYINPVVALILGVIFLGESPGIGSIAGLALILAGSWAATSRAPAAREVLVAPETEEEAATSRRPSAAVS
jgi:drug/metabolite transporter (DMT)-like permease